MTNSKPWWKSKGIIGAVVAIVPQVASMMGYTITPEDITITYNSMVSAFGGVLALWGRISAQKQVTLW